MISNITGASAQSISAYSSFNHSQTQVVKEQSLQLSQHDEVSISAEAQQLFAMEQEYNFPPLSKADMERVDKLNAEIDKILGTEEIQFSKADEKSADKLYQQIDNIFADDKVTKEEEKLLAKIDGKLDDIYEKYEKPLTQEQEQKLEGLFAELDSIYGVDEEGVGDDLMADLFQELGLSEADQEKANKINGEIDKILGVDETVFSDQDLDAADELFEQMDRIFADDKVTKDEEKQLAKLDEQLDNIYQKYEKPLTKDDEEKLDELFGQLDQLYGLS